MVDLTLSYPVMPYHALSCLIPYPLRKGSAVLWYSVQRGNLAMDPRTDHEAQAVTKGMKYGGCLPTRAGLLACMLSTASVRACT